MGVLQYSRLFLLWAIAVIGIAHALFEESASEREDVASAAQRRAYAGESKEASTLEDSTTRKNKHDLEGEPQLARRQPASLVPQEVASEQQPPEEQMFASARARNPKALIRTHIIGDRVVSESGDLEDVPKLSADEQIIVELDGDRPVKISSEKTHDAALAAFMRKSKADQEMGSIPSDAKTSDETDAEKGVALDPFPSDSLQKSDDQDPGSRVVVGAQGETNTGSEGATSASQSSVASPDMSSQLGSAAEGESLPEADDADTEIESADDTESIQESGAEPGDSRESQPRVSCCEHRRRRQVVANKCTTSKKGNGERWWCDLDFPNAGVCGCFGGEGTGHKAECAWCGKDVFHGEPGDQECKFVNKKMTMSGCDKDASGIKEIAPWFSGWGEYILCENGFVASGKNATCHRSGGQLTGYHQRWFSDDCNFVYIFYYHNQENVHNAFSVLTHLDREQRFKHEHWLHSTYIECDAKSSTCAGSY
jgi:hypothetical protein